MSFRMRTALRLLFSLIAAIVLTGLALSTRPAEAQLLPPLFVKTSDAVFAAYPFEERVERLDMPAGSPFYIHLSPDGTRLLVQTLLDGDPSRTEGKGLTGRTQKRSSRSVRSVDAYDGLPSKHLASITFDGLGSPSHGR